MNTQKAVLISIVLLLLVGVGTAAFLFRDQSGPVSVTPPLATSTPSVPSSTPPLGPTVPTTSTEALIRVTTPTPNLLVRSPLLVQGEARGTWYFEASFPVKLLDANGQQLAIIPAQAQSDWMTESFVPFKAELRFTTPTTETGTLVFEKDNPSGLPEQAAEYRIPVRFSEAATTSAEQRVVKLYYYNANKDKDSSGNILCSRKGLEAVTRTIPRTQTPIRDAVELLLRGGLTAEERASGLMTEFPLSGVELRTAVVTSTTLTLTFADPQNKTSGGSCRATVLWAQIEATAKQFGGIDTVKFLPETLFQP